MVAFGNTKVGLFFHVVSDCGVPGTHVHLGGVDQGREQIGLGMERRGSREERLGRTARGKCSSCHGCNFDEANLPTVSDHQLEAQWVKAAEDRRDPVRLHIQGGRKEKGKHRRCWH